MLLTRTTNLTSAEAAQLIEAARNAELCRNLEASRKILGEVLGNLDEPLRIDGLDVSTQAEILRLCGFFLNNYGRSRNLKDYQERGKDFLTTAVEMFDREDQIDKSAEAKVMLALCYWHEGAVAECEMILSETEAQFQDDRHSPVYIQICVNRLMTHYWKQEFREGLEIIENLSESVEQCADARIKTLYHNQAGIIYRVLKQPEQAIQHLHEAIKAARGSGNLLFAAVNLNNLGNAYKDMGEFALARQCVDDSREIFRQLGEYAWQAYPLDTKAQIYFAEKDFTGALEKSDEALAIYRETNDYAGLVDSLFTKIKILLRLDRTSEALLLFAELTDTCQRQIGEFAAQKYAAELAKLVHPLKNLSYPEEVRSFKTHVLKDSLRENDLQVTKAAAALGISHQNLSDILNNQFPQLFEEVGIRRRAPRNSVREKKKVGKKNTEKPGDRISPVNLSQSEMKLSDVKLSDEATYFTFALPGKRLPGLRLKREVVVLVENSDARLGAPVIVRNRETKEFRCGFFEKDEWTEVLYFKDTDKKTDVPVLMPDELKCYGKIIGYCPLDEVSDGSPVIFTPLAKKRK